MLFLDMLDNKSLAVSFLQKIHYYYPIGMPHFMDDYPGYMELKRIQHEKMLRLEKEEPANWFQLIDEMKKEWSGEHAVTASAAPFPCYKLRIALEREAKTGFVRNSSLIVAISLLVNYYAITVVDDYVYMYQDNNDAIAGHKVVCSGENYHLPILDKIARLKQRVERHFPGYVHAPHEVIFRYKVLGGFAYTGWYEYMDQSVIYDYLFSHDFTGVKYTVAH
jgi:hypothetical protein